MLRFTERQRCSLGATIRELANYGAATLVFGQFVSNQVASWWMGLAGIAIWLTLVSLALAIEEGQR
jgi:protein-S-isoprenylcysteine O-methyltransferase Ste14